MAMNLTPQQQGHLIFGVILMLGGVALAVYGFNNKTRFERLAKESRSVMSLPITDYKAVNSRRGQHTTYVVEPSFVAKDGKTYTCKGGISQETMQKVEDNLTIMIDYVPSEPTVCKVEGALVNENSSDSDGAIFGGGVIGFGALIYLWRKAIKSKNLANSGL